MSDEEQTQWLAKSPGKQYMIADFFAYDRHDLLPDYELAYAGGMKELINYYMIDFRNICRVQTASSANPTSTKRLQLSIQARGELRDKLANYFGRKPEEDAL